MKRALKIALLFFALLATYACPPKSIYQIYRYQNLPNSAQLTLGPQQTFEYRSTSCIAYCYSVRGFGHYAIQADSLYLNFQGPPDSTLLSIQKTSLLQKKTQEQKRAEVSTLSVNVVVINKKDTSNMPGAIVACSPCSPEMQAIPINPQEQGIQGVQWELESAQFPISINISYIGYHPFTLQLEDGNQDYELWVELQERPTYDKETVWLTGAQRFHWRKVKDSIFLNNTGFSQLKN